MDSLLLNTYELIGTVTDSWVELEREYVLGQPVADIAVIVGTLLSGDRVTGSRSGNRTITLPLTVTGTTRLDMAVNVNKLISIVDDTDPFTLQWTPNGGLPVVFDCYRGSFERVRVDVIEQQFSTTVNLTFTAQPYGRSDVPQTIAVTTSSPPQLDSLDSVTAPTNATRDTTNKYEGTSSAAITLTRGSLSLFGQTYYRYTSPKIVKAISSTNLTSFSGLSLRFRWNAPTGPGQPYSVTVKLYVSDGTNESNAAVNISLSPGDTSWHLLTFPFSKFTTTGGGAPATNMAAVTSWSLDVVTGNKTTATTTPSTANVDDIRELAASSVSNSTTEGSVLLIPGVLGTAPTPVALTVTRPASATMTGLLVHRPPVWQSPDAAILAALAGTPKTVTIPTTGNTYLGTYAVCLVATALGTGTRTVTVTLVHKQGATTLATQVIATTYTTPPTGNFIIVGQTTLPLVPVPAENSSDTLVITVTSAGGTPDTFSDVALLDTYGQEQTYGSLPSGTTVVYVDEPDGVAEIGPAYASATDRTAAVGLLGWGAATRADGGPVVFEPGDNRLLLVAPDGAPQVAATFYPRWLDERTA